MSRSPPALAAPRRSPYLTFLKTPRDRSTRQPRQWLNLAAIMAQFVTATDSRPHQVCGRGLASPKGSVLTSCSILGGPLLAIIEGGAWQPFTFRVLDIADRFTARQAAIVGRVAGGAHGVFIFSPAGRITAAKKPSAA